LDAVGTPREPAARSLDEARFVNLVKGLCREFPTYGYRRIWALLRFREGLPVNRKRVQRVMQGLGLQIKRPGRPAARGHHEGKVQVLAPNLRWGMDTTKIWCGADGWGQLTAMVDYGDRVCVGYRFARYGRAQEAIDTLDAACAYRFPDRQIPTDLELRTDNGSAFGAVRFVDEVKRHGITLTKTFYRSPEGNAILERFFRSLKEECAWQHTFNSLAEAERAIVEWIRHYNEERPHSACGYLTPVAYHKQLLESQAGAA
jgi:putative transposase